MGQAGGQYPDTDVREVIKEARGHYPDTALRKAWGKYSDTAVRSVIKLGFVTLKNYKRITNRLKLVEEARSNTEIRLRGSNRTQNETIPNFPRFSGQKNLSRLKEQLMQSVTKKIFNQEKWVLLGTHCFSSCRALVSPSLVVYSNMFSC